MRRPLHFDGGAGRCYATLYLPERPPVLQQPGVSAGVLFVPPFAEEMNKARRMASLLGARVAETGRLFLMPDLWGTGDSDGDFADAAWEIWLEDLCAAARLLREQGVETVDLVALRLGALLACEGAGRLPLRVERLLLWQPATSGRQYLAQFLRLRVAGALAQGRAETVQAIRAELETAGAIEVGGYTLSRWLAEALESVQLEPAGLDVPGGVTWFDIASDPQRPLPVGSQKTVDAWRSAGTAVWVERVRGDAFWATQEITEVPALIDATLRVLAEQPA